MAIIIIICSFQIKIYNPDNNKINMKHGFYKMYRILIINNISTNNRFKYKTLRIKMRTKIHFFFNNNLFNLEILKFYLSE